MESVNYEYFDSENDYSKNPNATKHRSFNVSRGDFSKYAILNGFYGKKLISRDAMQIAIQNGHLCHVRRSVCDIIGGQPKTN